MFVFIGTRRKRALKRSNSAKAQYEVLNSEQLTVAEVGFDAVEVEVGGEGEAVDGDEGEEVFFFSPRCYG